METSIYPSLTTQQKREIIKTVGKIFKLKINYMCLEKIEHASDASSRQMREAPLGSVIVFPLMLLRHLPKYWWHYAEALHAAKQVVPDNRPLFIIPQSALTWASAVEDGKKNLEELRKQRIAYDKYH